MIMPNPLLPNISDNMTLWIILFVLIVLVLALAMVATIMANRKESRRIDAEMSPKIEDVPIRVVDTLSVVPVFSYLHTGEKRYQKVRSRFDKNIIYDINGDIFYKDFQIVKNGEIYNVPEHLHEIVFAHIVSDISKYDRLA